MRVTRSPYPQPQHLIVQGVPDWESNQWTGQQQALLQRPYIHGFEDNGVGGIGLKAQLREPLVSRQTPLREAPNSFNSNAGELRPRPLMRGATSYLAKDSGPDLVLDDEMGDCIEGMLQSLFFDLSVMSFNLNFYADWPRDAEGAYNKMVEIIENQPPPDVICVQEGLTGIDRFNELGYLLVRSSSSCSQPLNQALYNDPDVLNDVDDASSRRSLVNEVYVKGDGIAKTSWEIADHGAEPLRSAEESAFVVRSVVWVKLRHRSRPQGPYVYIFNTQLSGGPLEEKRFSQAAIRSKRLEQVEHILQLVESIDKSHLVFLVGELGAEGGANDTDTHFRLLEGKGWKLAYGQDQVGPTSNLGQLVDHMATNRSVPAQVKVFPTTNQRGELPVTQVPLSNHNAVKATFSIRYDVIEADNSESVKSAQFEDRARTPKLFVPMPRPDPYDMSYTAQCARFECEYHDLMEERNLEQQSMEDITTELSERMWQLRNECSDQLHGNSHITQLMQNAHAVLTSINDSWASKHAALLDELQDAEFQRHRLETETNAESAEIQNQVEASEKQQEDMEASRRALGRHLDSMDKSIEVFKHDIVEERKMTKEIKEAGDQNLKERSERYTKEAEYLQSALKQFEQDHTQYVSDAEQELLRAQDELRVLESELAESRQLLAKENAEFKEQCEDFKSECEAKDQERTENDARIQSEIDEMKRFEDPRDSYRGAIETSREERRRLQERSSTLQTETNGLTKEIVRLEKKIGDLSHLWPENWDTKKSRFAEEVNEVDEELELLDSELESEEQRGERLQALLEQAQKRRGICAYLCPRPGSKIDSKMGPER